MLRFRRKLILTIFFPFYLILILYSCNDTGETTLLNDYENLFIKQYIKIDGEKKALYSPDEKRYIEYEINTQNQGFLLEIDLNYGIEYRILLSNLNTDLAEIQLFDKWGNEFSFDQNQDIGHTQIICNFQCYESQTYYIGLKYNLPINQESLNIRISIEEIGTKYIDINGDIWQCDGDWKMTNNGELQFIGFESFIYKWIRIPVSQTGRIEVNVSVSDEPKNTSMFYGLSFSENDDLYKMVNIPLKAYYYKVRNTGQAEFWNIDINNTGINLETTQTSIKNSTNTLSLNIKDTSLFYKDSTLLFRNSVGFTPEYIYLIVEETENDTITINSITLTKY